MHTSRSSECRSRILLGALLFAAALMVSTGLMCARYLRRP